GGDGLAHRATFTKGPGGRNPPYVARARFTTLGPYGYPTRRGAPTAGDRGDPRRPRAVGRPGGPDAGLDLARRRGGARGGAPADVDAGAVTLRGQLQAGGGAGQHARAAAGSPGGGSDRHERREPRDGGRVCRAGARDHRQGGDAEDRQPFAG